MQPGDELYPGDELEKDRDENPTTRAQPEVVGLHPVVERARRPALYLQRLRAAATKPVRASDGAAGLDLAAAEAATIPPQGVGVVKIGWAMAIPGGTYARIAPRSGLAAKKAIDVGAGVVDFDYRGEVGVVLFNHGAEPLEVKVGDRIAQLIIERISIVDCHEVEQLPNTERGPRGFGSTGTVAAQSEAQGPGSDTSETHSSMPSLSDSEEQAPREADVEPQPVLPVQPRGERQERLGDSLLNMKVPLTVAAGSAGTGKTMIACAAAVALLRTNKIKTFIYTRCPAGPQGSALGFLPGNEAAKMSPWLRPIEEYLRSFFTAEEYEHYKKAGALQPVAIEYMRGQTWKNALILVDEAQNLTEHALRTLTTRVGWGAKLVLAGAEDQADIAFSGLAPFMTMLLRARTGLAKVIRFGPEDSHRSGLAKLIEKLYQEKENQQRLRRKVSTEGAPSEATDGPAGPAAEVETAPASEVEAVHDKTLRIAGDELGRHLPQLRAVIRNFATLLSGRLPPWVRHGVLPSDKTAPPRPPRRAAYTFGMTVRPDGGAHIEAATFRFAEAILLLNQLCRQESSGRWSNVQLITLGEGDVLSIKAQAETTIFVIKTPHKAALRHPSGKKYALSTADPWITLTDQADYAWECEGSATARKGAILFLLHLGLPEIRQGTRTKMPYSREEWRHLKALGFPCTPPAEAKDPALTTQEQKAPPKGDPETPVAAAVLQTGCDQREALREEDYWVRGLPEGVPLAVPTSDPLGMWELWTRVHVIPRKTFFDPVEAPVQGFRWQKHRLTFARRTPAAAFGLWADSWLDGSPRGPYAAQWTGCTAFRRTLLVGVARAELPRPYPDPLRPSGLTVDDYFREEVCDWPRAVTDQRDDERATPARPRTRGSGPCFTWGEEGLEEGNPSTQSPREESQGGFDQSFDQKSPREPQEFFGIFGTEPDNGVGPGMEEESRVATIGDVAMTQSRMFTGLPEHFPEEAETAEGVACAPTIPRVRLRDPLST